MQKGSLNEIYMTELGINKNIRDRILTYLNHEINEAIRNIGIIFFLNIFGIEILKCLNNLLII